MKVDRSNLIKMYQNGLISSKPYQYLEIKSKVKQYESSGLTKTESVNKTAKLLGCTERTVWNALKGTKGLSL